MEEKTVRGRTHALIVSGGFCDTVALCSDPRFPEWTEGAWIAAADSGFESARRMGLSPDLVCGDFDSYTDALPAGPEILRVPAEKDVTDTVLACEVAMERGFSRLILFGGTGGRADHSLSNILWLWSLKNRGADAFLTDGRNEFRVLRDESCRIPRSEGAAGERVDWYFSLFALGECRVRASGCRYPIPAYTRLSWDNPSFAVSNEVKEEEALIETEGPVLLVRSRK